jgi:hypothetical protein
MAGINKQNVIWIVAFFFRPKYKLGCWFRKKYWQVNLLRHRGSFLLNQILANVSFGTTRKQNPCGKTMAMVPLSSSWCTMCCTKAKSALELGARVCHSRETIVGHVQRTRRPVGREWRIGHDGFKTQIMLWAF